MVEYLLAMQKVEESCSFIRSRNFYNMEKCMRCKHNLILESNFMLSEINGEELSENDDAMVTYAHCPYCGARYELTDTPENEKKNYPYWN